MPYSHYERPLTLFDIFGAIFRYWGRVLCVTLVMSLLCTVAIAVYPKKYESEAKVFVRLGRGSASLDPSTMGQTISIQESRESEMNSIVDMLTSRGLAEQVVDRVGQEKILQKYAWIEVTTERWSDRVMRSLKRNFDGMFAGNEPEFGLSAGEVSQRNEYELAVKELIQNLNIDSPKRSTTISIAYRGRTPELAQEVVQAVLDAYQKMHIEAYRSGGVLDFFNEQFEEQELLVGQTEDLFREKKNANAVVTIEGKQQSLQTEITEIKKLQLETKADLHSARAKVEALTAELDALPIDMLSAKTLGMPQNARDAMRDRLYSLEIEEKNLASKYSDSHPNLMKVREQLQSARKIIDAQPDERQQSVIAINPVRLDIENQMYLAQANAASLDAKVKALETLEKELYQRLSDINDLELEAFEMQRKIDIARRNHMNYAAKLEESRINAALDRESLSNVSVVTKPSLQYKHVSPKRSLLVVLGLLFSVCCGFVVALASDYVANAREMRVIHEAERQSYLRELQQANARSSSEPRQLTPIKKQTVLAAGRSVARAESDDDLPDSFSEDPDAYLPADSLRRAK